ncbi:MAG: aminotransferase DegT [Deltaproteobacteria bacterium]|nr:MAG: aminotransferase DegT [Deltaproteobacteria bacterium]
MAKTHDEQIDFANLAHQHFLYASEIEQELDSVINNAQFILGSKVEALEERLQTFTRAKFAITCSSGTDALVLALMALDIGTNDEVITTPFTFIATAEAIALVGARPVFVDIDEQTYNIDASKIEAAITARTKAIIPVSLYGQPSDLSAIEAIAKAHQLKVIIDGAQSFGATFEGISDSALGDLSCTSFFPAKPLGCYGDGGAVFTNDKALAQKIKQLRIHGQNERYKHKYIGLGARLDAIQAAVLLVKLAHYEDDLRARQEVAQKYTNALSDANVITPFIANNRTSAWAQYSIRVKNRDALQEALKRHSIPTAVHYPLVLHLQECFAHLGYKMGDFAVAERISNEILSLPMNPYLSDAQIEKIANVIVKTCASH